MPLLLVIVAYVLVRAFYWDCQPIWDGSAYSTALLSANKGHFDLLKFTLDEHIAQAFFLIMSIPCRLYKHNFYLFNVWLTLFGTLSVVAFHQLLAFFCAGKARASQLALVTALFAFHPTVLASMIHFTLDIGLLTFALCYWVLLLQKRVVLATIAGVIFMLTKETATLLLPLFLLATLMMQPRGLRFAWLKRNCVAGIVPYVAWTAFFLYKGARGHSAVWNQYQTSGPFAALLNAITPDVMMSNYAGLLFLLNFNWIFFLLWTGLFVMLWRKRHESELQPHFKAAVSIVLLFLLSSAAVFVVRPFSNARYLLVPIAIMLVGVGHLLLVQIRLRSFPLIGVVALLGLLGIENFRTADPVSRAFFGTFDFGKHSLLSISRRTGECNNFGRDQLVYNLQFLEFPRVIARMLEDLRPTPDTFVLCAPSANWLALPHLNNATCKPEFGLTRWFTPHYTDWYQDKDESKFTISGRAYALAELPSSLYFVKFPNVDNQSNQRLLNILSTRFSRKSEKVYDVDGYQITLVHFAEH
ncbi:MAG TPA: hypothetical protein VFB72_19290 [Verrucomicrobiae bacterium]|nr:hypothetical protein [Verrucomicrobiae bacterium]